MDEKFLIANHLVPDNEVWVSPKTFENPFSKNVSDVLNSSHNNARDEIAAAEKLCKLYFDIAASCIGEEAVRQRVAAATSPVA
jgi:hypothetical protein